MSTGLLITSVIVAVIAIACLGVFFGILPKIKKRHEELEDMVEDLQDDFDDTTINCGNY